MPIARQRAVVARLLKDIARIRMDYLAAAQSISAPQSDALPFVPQTESNQQIAQADCTTASTPVKVPAVLRLEKRT